MQGCWASLASAFPATPPVCAALLAMLVEVDAATSLVSFGAPPLCQGCWTAAHLGAVCPAASQAAAGQPDMGCVARKLTQPASLHNTQAR